MSERIIDLSDEPARLCVRTGNLVIERRDRPEVFVPLREVGVVVLSNPQISITHAVVSELARAGGILVSCDARRLPVAMLMPLEANYVQTERMGRQIGASLPIKKRLWKDLVAAKVRSQAAALVALHGDDGGLAALAPLVRSGDPSNIEARAASRYWPLVFCSPDYRRDRDAADSNRFLNYGYAVLRAIITRALCAAGLHPSIGIHHKNRYNAFALADDVMEPFRAIVDVQVVELCRTIGADAELDKHVKAEIIGGLMGRFSVAGERRTLFDIAGRTAASINAIFARESDSLALPNFKTLFNNAATEAPAELN